MKIFACDDEILMLNLLENAIKKAVPTAELITFSSSVKLLEYAKNNAPDIVFLDIKMPDMDGISLAKELMTIYPKLNVIFVTGYNEFAGEAFNLYASGYISKPIDVTQVSSQIAHLRFPVSASNRFYAQTFGNFTLFDNGKPLYFPREKCKEIMAFLIDRNGAEVSRRELALYVFEDEVFSREIQKYLSNILKFLTDALKEQNASELLIHSPKGYAIDKANLSSDLFDFLEGRTPDAFKGEYMEQYSWGENFKSIHFNLNYDD